MSADNLLRLREWLTGVASATALSNGRRSWVVSPEDAIAEVERLRAEPEPADAEAPKGHLWLVQLASDTDEACAWERALDNLILKMSRQGRLVGDEPERLGFLVCRGVQLMRQDHNEKIDAQRDKSGACGSAGQSDHGVLRLPSPAGAPASGVEGDRRDGGDHGCEAPEQRGEVRGSSEAAGGEGLLRAGGDTGEVDPPSEPEPAPTDPERAVIGWVSDNCGLTVAQEAELARRLESLRQPAHAMELECEATVTHRRGCTCDRFENPCPICGRTTP